MNRIQILSLLLATLAACNATPPEADDPTGGDEVALDEDGKADAVSSSKLKWNARAGRLVYALTRATGFDQPGGPSRVQHEYKVVVDGSGRVAVGGDGTIPTDYRFHRTDLAAPDAKNSVVQPAVRVLAAPVFTRTLAPGNRTSYVDPPKPRADRVTLQSRYTTTIVAVAGDVVTFRTDVAYRFAQNRALEDLLGSGFGPEAAKLRWMAEEWTDYAVCKGEFDKRRGLLLAKRCVERVLTDRGTRADQVSADPKRTEVAVELVAAP